MKVNGSMEERCAKVVEGKQQPGVGAVGKSVMIWPKLGW